MPAGACLIIQICGQAFALVDIKNRIAFQEPHTRWIIAGLRGAFFFCLRNKAVSINNHRAAFALADIPAKLQRLFERHPFQGCAPGLNRGIPEQ